MNNSPSLMLNNDTQPLLSVHNLSKRFDASESFLWQNVSFDLNAGESLSICGESGSGKSTLLFAIGGLETVQSGTMRFEGKPLTHSQPAWVPGISYIFQHYHLIEELTVAENITLPVRMHPHLSHGSIQTLAEALNLQPLLERLPTHLSGGERQRVAIARALITQPTLLLADEPTGSLDEATGTRVMDLLLQTCNTFHTACILVTHNNAFAMRTQRHFVLKHQQLKEVP